MGVLTDKDNAWWIAMEDRIAAELVDRPTSVL